MRTISHMRLVRACVAVIVASALGVVADPVDANAASRDPIAQLAVRVLAEVSMSSADSPLRVSTLRHQLAVAVARRTGVNTASLEQSWEIAPREHQIAVVAALTQVGVKYREYASKPGVALDCSSFTQFAWKTAGYSIPRRAKWQGTAETRVTRKKLRAGDLVVRDTHVYLYLGTGNLVVHSPYTGALVRFRVLPWSRMSSSRLSNPVLKPEWKTPAPKVVSSSLSGLVPRLR